MSKKLAVIVGAGKGMGYHIAEKFAQENFKVVLIARRQTALDEYVAEFTAKVMRFILKLLMFPIPLHSRRRLSKFKPI